MPGFIITLADEVFGAFRSFTDAKSCTMVGSYLAELAALEVRGLEYLDCMVDDGQVIQLGSAKRSPYYCMRLGKDFFSLILLINDEHVLASNLCHSVTRCDGTACLMIIREENP